MESPQKENSVVSSNVGEMRKKSTDKLRRPHRHGNGPLPSALRAEARSPSRKWQQNTPLTAISALVGADK
jgi:hypothetical protein